MARAQSPSLHYGTALVADIIARAQAEPPSAKVRARSIVGTGARLVGQVWTALIVLGVLVVCLFELMPSFDHGTILSVHGDLGQMYLLAALAMPGYALFRWGSARLNPTEAR